MKLGAPREKINIGLALYGRSFTLQNGAKHNVGSPAKGGGKAGTFTQEEGYLAFYEVGIPFILFHAILELNSHISSGCYVTR